MRPEDIWQHMNRTDPSGCWSWTRATDGKGYGLVQIDGPPRATRRVHRVAWELVNGPIPDGITVDHGCRNRLCSNPAHLRLLTRSANSRANGHSTKTHCPQGHEYTPENTYLSQTKYGINRQCRACQRERTRRTAPLRRNYMHAYYTAHRVLKGRAMKTHCPQGHEYTPENTMVGSDGWRKCKECNRARAKANYLKKRGQA